MTAPAPTPSPRRTRSPWPWRLICGPIDHQPPVRHGYASPPQRTQLAGARRGKGPAVRRPRRDRNGAAVLAPPCQVLDRSGPRPNRYDPDERIYLTIRTGAARP